MQITSYDNYSGIVSDSCPKTKCDGMKKMTTIGSDDPSVETVQKSFKDFQDETTN